MHASGSNRYPFKLRQENCRGARWKFIQRAERESLAVDLSRLPVRTRPACQFQAFNNERDIHLRRRSGSRILDYDSQRRLTTDGDRCGNFGQVQRENGLTEDRNRHPHLRLYCRGRTGFACGYGRVERGFFE